MEYEFECETDSDMVEEFLPFIILALLAILLLGAE